MMENITLKWIIIALLTFTYIVVTQNVIAADNNNLKIRGRIINVAPNDDSGEVTGISGSGVSVDSATTIEVDFTYMFSPKLGLELILATTKHAIPGSGALSGLGKIGEAGVLPPTLTAQYHFIPNGKYRPYAGAGLNYTLFYSEETTASLGNTSLKLDDSIGLAVQGGIDIDINKSWYINIDLKYIQVNTTATLGSGATVDVDINPWVFGIGAGSSFNL